MVNCIKCLISYGSSELNYRNCIGIRSLRFSDGFMSTLGYDNLLQEYMNNKFGNLELKKSYKQLLL